MVNRPLQLCWLARQEWSMFNQLLYSCHDLIFTSSMLIAVKASINALAKRTLVIKGML